MSTAPTIEIKPQLGPQETFLSSPADIVIYGGAAGGGKTFGLLMDPLRYVENPDFGAVIFRRTYPEITQEMGIWEESQKLYGHFETRVNESDLKHTFQSGATVRFAHLQYEKTKYNYKSSQIAYLGFDELTSFTESQFFYLLSRNRSVSGVPPCVRACTNPEPGWVAELIRWWLYTDEGHPRYGYPIESRAGRVRYFARGTDDELVWGGSKAEVLEKAPHLREAEIDPEHMIKSLTFIPATVYDNKILLEKNPEYLANLKMQDKVERERLLGGNWLVRAKSGDYFAKEDFEVVSPYDVPSRIDWSRHWDLAGTKPSKENPDPDWTAGSLLGEKEGVVFWKDCVMLREQSSQVEKKVHNTASQDGYPVPVWFEQEPGQSGKSQVRHFQRNVLKGYTVRAHRPSGDKETRVRPAAAAAQRGDIKVVRGPWNKKALAQLEQVPDGKWDVADTLSQFWETRMAGRTGKTRQRNYRNN